MFGIHGAGGTLGALLTGVFATRGVNPIFKDAAPVGLFDGNPAQLINQIIGIGVAVLIASVGSYLLLKIVDSVIGARVGEEEEITGLDLSQHGEEAYEIGLELMGATPSIESARLVTNSSRVAAHNLSK